jgi:ATP-dependent Lon protease
VPAKPKQPDYVLPLLPLRGMLVFPHMVTSLEVGRSRSLLAVEAAMLRDKRYLILAAQRDAQKEEPETEDIYPYGALVEVKQLLRLPEERVRVLVAGICRVRITNYNSTQPYYEVAAMVPSRIFSKACCTPSPDTSRVMEGFSDLRAILSTSSMYTMPFSARSTS